jgi:ABC-type transport system involved in multi-copper enzyme maturation permease subunit
MRVLAATMVDTLRYLRSRYMFWIVLAMSAIGAVALFATYSFTPEGIRFLWFEPIENADLKAGSPGSRVLILGLFNGMFVKFWLGWGAMILALVSTASIVPDFLRGGSIDLSLSRPIRRPVLFMYKYLGVLLFALIQLTIAVGFAYLLIGIRFDMWLPKALLAIPLLSLQFAYLSCISTFLAVVTRSTIASLLGTILIWFVTFLIQFSSNSLTEQTASLESLIATQQQRIENGERAIANADNPNPRVVERIEQTRQELDGNERLLRGITPWERRLGMAELFVPKTGDLQKILARQVEAPVGNEFFAMLGANQEEMRPAGMSQEEWDDMQAASTEGSRAVRDFSAAQSIGTSLAISFALLGFATWRFSRRDF